jgi:hypothetical protein
MELGCQVTFDPLGHLPQTGMAFCLPLRVNRQGTEYCPTEVDTRFA